MFDVEKFKARRKGNFGKELFYFDEIDSTNRAAADFAREKVREGTVVIAESQSAGRGRNSHIWYSPAEENLYFTVILYPPAERLHYLPFLSALSLIEALESLGLHCDLKWPNDLLVNGKKISGVLIQTSMEENQLQFALIGIGINVNAKSFPPDLQPIAASIATETGMETERERLLASILWELERLYREIRNIKWEDLTSRVKGKSSFLEGCEIQVEQQGKMITGRTAGVDPLGGLIVQTSAGREVFYAGEIQACRKK
jgi:BirA family biotin operon repressor/biotin-[acetyl-CoA-carboxylase] ligase